jgi:membrane protein
MRLFKHRADDPAVEYPRSYYAPRPEPDEAEPEVSPQPEQTEPKLRDPELSDLSRADWIAIVKRAGKSLLAHNLTMIAQALAYSSFMAIPSVLLVAVGMFTLVAGPSTIHQLIAHMHTFMPAQATQLISQSLLQLDAKPSSGIVMTIIGFVLAVWSTTGAMTSYMTAVNIAYDRKDRRSFVKKRLTAVIMVACVGFAFVLVAALLIFGPVLEAYVGHTLHIQPVLSIVWWVAQWPVLIVGLLAAFATLLYLGPDVDHPRWRFLSLGSAAAVVIWLVASGAFAVYTTMFSSYNKTWGSLAAVIVMMTWLWLAGLALLFGAEINAEAERSRELRQGEPAHEDIQAPSRA